MLFRRVAAVGVKPKRSHGSSRCCYPESAPPQDRVVEKSVQVLCRSAGALAIREIASALGQNRRRLQRSFLRQVGIPPKRLAGILRFQRVFRLLESTPGVPWAFLALDCGYYDQAHLIRDFRRFTGESPRAYLASQHVVSDLFTGLG